jgi:hypothetical protein
MATNLTIAVNTDTQDQPYGTSGVDWEVMDLTNDYLIFTAGNNVVKDGESLPSQNDLNQAGIDVTDAVEIIVDKYLLADFDVDLLKEISLLGDLDSRYVLAFVFDGATASEPVFELWDNVDLDTVDSVVLGNGTPNNSYFKGKVTTNGSAGAPGWTGTPLAGSSSGNFLLLNEGNGALTGAGTLYCTFKIVIPASQSESGAETPIFAVKYTTN